MYAYFWESGVVEFDRKIPDGALEIARGEAKKLRKFLEPKLMSVIKMPRKWGGEHFLIPQILHAQIIGKNNLDIVLDFIEWLNKCKPPKGIVLADVKTIKRHKWIQ